MRHFSYTTPTIPGGTTETESRNISGLETIAAPTFANAKLKGIVTNLIRALRAIAILF